MLHILRLTLEALYLGIFINEKRFKENETKIFALVIKLFRQFSHSNITFPLSPKVFRNWVEFYMK